MISRACFIFCSLYATYLFFALWGVSSKRKCLKTEIESMKQIDYVTTLAIQNSISNVLTCFFSGLLAFAIIFMLFESDAYDYTDGNPFAFLVFFCVILFVLSFIFNTRAKHLTDEKRLKNDDYNGARIIMRNDLRNCILFKAYNNDVYVDTEIFGWWLLYCRYNFSPVMFSCVGLIKEIHKSWRTDDLKTLAKAYAKEYDKFAKYEYESFRKRIKQEQIMADYLERQRIKDKRSQERQQQKSLEIQKEKEQTIKQSGMFSFIADDPRNVLLAHKTYGNEAVKRDVFTAWKQENSSLQLLDSEDAKEISTLATRHEIDSEKFAAFDSRCYSLYKHFESIWFLKK